jgi:hypothetical protein
MEVDFRIAARRLKGGGHMAHYRLFQGDNVSTVAGRMQVLWPPRSLGAEARESIVAAVTSFEELIEQPALDRLRRLYEEASEVVRDTIGSGYEIYRDDEGTNPEIRAAEVHQAEEAAEEESVLDSLPGPLRDRVQTVNEALRRAANYCCLAFCVGERLLCLSDLDSSALDGAIEHLSLIGRLDHHIAIAPHHGTVWSDELLKLRANHLVVSVGDELWRYVKPRLGYIGRSVHFSRVSGDFRLAY